jgi:hypothetical protein
MIKKYAYKIKETDPCVNPILYKYSHQYKTDGLLFEDITGVRGILQANDGYLVFSSIDNVEIKKYEDTEDTDFVPLGKIHGVEVEVPTALITTYYTELIINGKLSIYDLSTGEEVFKATHKLIRNKEDKAEKTGCINLGCSIPPIDAILDAYIDKKSDEEKFNDFAGEVINEFYSDIIGRFLK